MRKGVFYHLTTMNLLFLNPGADVERVVTLYVSTRGQDKGSNCTEHAPCKTVQYAVDRAQGGDQVLIEGAEEEDQYPVRKLVVNKQLRIAYWKGTVPTIKCEDDIDLHSDEQSEECDITFQKQATGSSTFRIKFSHCDFCLQVSNFTSNSTVYNDSTITIASLSVANVTIASSNLQNTSITLKTSLNDTDIGSNIDLKVTNTSVHGGNGFIQATENIAELDLSLDIANSNISDIGGLEFISLTNYEKLSFDMTNSLVSKINVDHHGIFVCGSNSSQTQLKINSCGFENITLSGSFIRLTNPGQQTDVEIADSRFIKAESFDSGSVLSVGKITNNGRSRASGPVQPENSTAVIRLSAVHVENCSSSESGGAIYLQVGELHLRNCSFVNNTARRRPPPNGIYLNIFGVTFFKYPWPFNYSCIYCYIYFHFYP